MGWEGVEGIEIRVFGERWGIELFYMPEGNCMGDGELFSGGMYMLIYVYMYC